MGILEALRDPVRLFLPLVRRGLLDWVPDKPYLMLAFRANMGRWPNLKRPETYNEKLQWLKLYDRRPEYSTMVDKCAVKEYVADIIGSEYIIPTLGVWDRFEDIDFDALPERFVLKCTHDSGGLVICRNKAELDIGAAREKINKFLKRKYFRVWREWPYKNVKPRILAEAYMEDGGTQELRDYKFFAFNGEAKLLFVATERQKTGEETKFDFFDMDYTHLNIQNGHPHALIPPEKPEQFQLMRQLTEKLAKGIPQLRVDFYEVNGAVYFGELTLFHWSGMVPFDPPEWDRELGSWIELPKKTV